MGLVNSIDDFYTTARSILVKSERYFDLYDQVFAHKFEGAELKEPDEMELAEVARALLEEWLKNPKELADAMGVDEDELSKMTPEELIEYFLERLKEQKLHLEVTQEAKDFLIEKGFDPVFGARPLKRTIQRYVEDPLASEIIAKKFKEGDTIALKCKNEELVFAEN